MAAFLDYRGLKRWIPAPSGPAGVILNDNFSELADRSGPIHSAAADPTVNDDDQDTAGNGKFYVWSKWLNTGTNTIFICIDSTATAAIWAVGTITLSTDGKIIIDGTQVLYLPNQTVFGGSVFYGDGGSNLVDNGAPDGKFNTSVGIGALDTNTEGDSNKAFGYEALEDNTTGARNLAFGYHALRKNISGDNNVALGDECLMDNTTGDENVCIGNLAGEDITGNGNICIGYKAGENQGAVSNRLYIENSNSATPLIYGEFDNNLIKIHGDLYIPSDSKKLYFGADTTDYTIQWDGSDAVHTITAGDFVFTGGNVGIGMADPAFKLEVNGKIGIDDVQVIYLPDQTNFTNSIFFGNGGASLSHGAGTEGQNNLGFGVGALLNVTTGAYNVGIGYAAGGAINAGTHNFILGTAFYNNTSGDYNVAIGNNTLVSNLIGNKNVAIGHGAGQTNTGNSSVFIGFQAGGQSGAVSNKLYIDCTNTVTPLIYGEFDNDLVKINGDLYIPSDSKKLYFGAANDATIGFDGNSLNIIANVVTGTDDLELTGQTIQLNGLTLATDKVIFTQIDGNEYIDSLADGFIDIGATTAIRFLADIKITADSRKLYFGAADTDYNITWDGDDAVHTITAGDFTFMGGNVGINESAPQDKLEVNGTGLFKGRIKLTQDDGNEYIEGVTDNYVDIGATTAIRCQAPILATDKVMFTQTDGDEYIDSLADGFIDYGATTAHRFLNDIKITQDNDKLYFGVADDVSITYTGTSWVFDIEAATATISMNPDGDDTDFVFGSTQLADAGTAAQDSRFFFDKGKGAFRAGKVTSTEWDTLGDQSTAFGLNTSATAAVSTALGQSSKADKHDQQAQSGGQFTAQGDAQGSTFIARKSITHNDANWYPLFLDGATAQLTLSSDTVWTFDILIVGTTSGCTKSFGFKIEGIIENDGGTTTILASNVTTLYDADDIDFDTRVTADDGTDALVIEVQDSSSGSDTVRWVAKVSTVETSF